MLLFPHISNLKKFSGCWLPERFQCYSDIVLIPCQISRGGEEEMKIRCMTEWDLEQGDQIPSRTIKGWDYENWDVPEHLSSSRIELGWKLKNFQDDQIRSWKVREEIRARSLMDQAQIPTEVKKNYHRWLESVYDPYWEDVEMYSMPSISYIRQMAEMDFASEPINPDFPEMHQELQQLWLQGYIPFAIDDDGTILVWG